MININISDELKAKCPNIAIGSIQCEIKVAPSDQPLVNLLDNACTEFAQKYTVEDISQLKPISDSRKAYRTLGKDPARYRLSSEALLRRIVKDKEIYKINNIVDINNLLSITSFYSICAFDVSKLNPPIRFTIGTKEDEYYGIGRGLLNIENLPVFEDQLGKFGSPTSDSERVKITCPSGSPAVDGRRANTTTLLSMNIISFSGDTDLENYLHQLKEYLELFASGKNIETRVFR